MTDVELEVMDAFERVFPVPTVVADWDDVLDRAGARSGTPTRPPSRWRVVAIAAAIVAGAALLTTPALGIGDRLLSLIQGGPTPLDVQAPAWSRDGRTIVFVSWRDGNGEVYAMDADGSGPRNLTQNPAKDVRPTWSPDGRRIAFVSRRDGNSEIYVMNADGSGQRNLTRDRARDNYPTWSPDGRKIAFLRARLYSNRVRGLGVHRFYGYHLYVMNADGSGLRRLTLNFTGRYQLVWSPDGRTIYFGRDLVSTDGSGARRLPYIPLTAVWSPDGRQIAFVNNPRRNRRPGQLGPCCIANSDVYVMNADGSGTRRLTHNAAYDGEPAWSPDGRKIAFQSKRRVGGNGEIYVMNADGSGKRNLTRNPAQDVRPSWSRDGRRIAFVSDRDGRLEAHVMNADGSGQRSLAQQGE
jgi:Tol biopolymer transport system component